MKQINFNDYAIKLSEGCHLSPQEGMCVMECVAYIAGEEHTDQPMCADPSLAWLAIQLNDTATSEKQRQKLLPFVLRLAGSKSKDFRLVKDREDVVLRERISLRQAYELHRFERVRLSSLYFVGREARVNRAENYMDKTWDKALATLDRLLPPLDLGGLAPEKSEVVETKLRELEEVMK